MYMFSNKVTRLVNNTVTRAPSEYTVPGVQTASPPAFGLEPVLYSSHPEHAQLSDGCSNQSE